MATDKPDPDVLKLYEKLRELQAQTFAVTEELGRRLSGGERFDTIYKRLCAAFDLAWCSRYAPGQTKQYQFKHTVARGQMRRFYNAYGEAELIDRFGVYVRNAEQFFVQARHSWGAFVASVNQHVPARQLERPIWSCHHDPPCGSELLCTRLMVMNDARRQAGKPLLVEERKL
jgi:hypothetical protein